MHAYLIASLIVTVLLTTSFIFYEQYMLTHTCWTVKHCWKQFHKHVFSSLLHSPNSLPPLSLFLHDSTLSQRFLLEIRNLRACLQTLLEVLGLLNSWFTNNASQNFPAINPCYGHVCCSFLKIPVVYSGGPHMQCNICNIFRIICSSHLLRELFSKSVD